MPEIMSMRSSIASPTTERPDSERRVDLHVYVVPTELWQDHLHSAVNQVISDTISAGFIRVFPEMTISNLRDELETQLGYELVPKNYVFLRCVGRCFTRLRPKQERSLKVKHFIPPQTYAPELFLLESSIDGDYRSGISSTGSSSSHANSILSSHFADDRPFPAHKPVPPIGVSSANEQSTQTGNEGWRSITPQYTTAPAMRAIVPIYQSSKSVQWPNDDDEDDNSKSTQTDTDDMRSHSLVNGVESLPMLIELHEEGVGDIETGAVDVGVGTESPVHPPLSATPTEMMTGSQFLMEQHERRRQNELNEAERRQLQEILRAHKEEEQRLLAEKEQKDREERARIEAEEKAAREKAERQRKAQEMRREEERRQREEEETRRRNAEHKEREEQLRRQMLQEEQRKIDDGWEQLKVDEQQVEEQRKKAAEQNRLNEERKRIEHERARLEEQRKKDEEQKRKLEQAKMNQTEAQELMKQIDELKSKRIQSERARDALISTARQLQNKARNNRGTGRDVWKKKYFEEKRKTGPLDEAAKKLRMELDSLHKKILHQMESNRRDVISGSGTVSSASQTPSEKSNLKIQTVRLQQEIEIIQRRIAEVNMKLTAEIKLRNQVEQENRSLKAELSQRRSQQIAGRTTNRNPAAAAGPSAASNYWAETKTDTR